MTPPFAPATSTSYKTDVFPLPSDVYGIYSMILCYYVAWPCDLDVWPFELESVSCTVLLMSDPHTNFTNDYRLLSDEYWIFDHISVIWISQCVCAESRDL